MTYNPAQDIIIGKAQKVLHRVNDLKEKVKKLEDALLLAKQQIEKERETNRDLGEQIKMFKLAQHLTETSATEKSEMKRKLNEMIQTVDLCIAQLSEENGE